MPRALDTFSDLPAGFSNYTAKYLQQIAAVQDDLIARLEVAGLRDEVHLRQPAWELDREMDIIASVAPERPDLIRYLGAYYGMQYLRMNVEAVNALRAGTVPGANRTEIYRRCLATVGASYSQLVVTFMRKVLPILAGGADLPPFAICGVGTLTDQDDVDVAVVVADKENRGALNSVLSRLSTVMLRYATRLHFYLSENVSPENFATALDEYRAYTAQHAGDYIVVSELLNAEPLCGDAALFETLRVEIIERYYAGTERNELYHKGFVRGALGDAITLARRELEADRLCPKDDALRIIKSLVQIKRAIHGLRETSIWENLSFLSRLEPWNAETYESLTSALAFFELFRYLYQLLVVQDELIIVDSPVMRENLSRVATTMGYGQRGLTNPVESLLVHYYDSIDRVRAGARHIGEEIESYLASTSVFLGLAGTAASAEPGEISRRALDLFRFLADVTFWDDVFELLEAPDRKFLRAVLADIDALPPEAKRARVAEWAEILKRNAELFMKFLVVLGEDRDDAGARELFVALNGAFLEEFGSYYNPAREATNLFFGRASWVNRYLDEIDYTGARAFMDMVGGPVDVPALEQAAAALRELCRLRYYGSAYLRRYLRVTLKKYPDCLHFLHDPRRLAEKSQGILAESAFVATPAEKKELLGDFYDLELLRAGLKTLDGATIEETNAEYTAFSDTYLKFLFDACREELAEDYGRWVTSFDVMAVYAAGGHAREWAFNDDYDLIVLLDSDDDKLRELGGAIISAMSAEICKRGIMPHYRFMEHFDGYVIPLSTLERFFRDRAEADFIEKSQVLESRLVVGTSTFEDNLYERVIQPFIFGDARRYIADMKAEMASRQQAVGDVISRNNIKECIGGLRDVIMATLICKARFAIRDPLTANILEAIGRAYPEAGLELRSIYNSVCFLKNLRDLYRLTVCVDDNLDFEHANVVGEILGFEGDGEGAHARHLRDAFERTTAKVAGEVKSLLAKIK